MIYDTNGSAFSKHCLSPPQASGGRAAVAGEAEASALSKMFRSYAEGADDRLNRWLPTRVACKTSPGFDVADKLEQLCLPVGVLPLDVTQQLAACDLQTDMLALLHETSVRARFDHTALFYFCVDGSDGVARRLAVAWACYQASMPIGASMAERSKRAMLGPAIVVYFKDDYVVSPLLDDPAALARLLAPCLGSEGCSDGSCSGEGGDECPICFGPLSDWQALNEYKAKVSSERGGERKFLTTATGGSHFVCGHLLCTTCYVEKEFAECPVCRCTTKCTDLAPEKKPRCGKRNGKRR